MLFSGSSCSSPPTKAGSCQVMGLGECGQWKNIEGDLNRDVVAEQFRVQLYNEYGTVSIPLL